MSTPIVKFLQARIAEDEASVATAREALEVQVKRRLLAVHTTCGTGGFCDDGGHAHDGIDFALVNGQRVPNSSGGWVEEADGGGPRCHVLECLTLPYTLHHEHVSVWTDRP